MLYGVFIGEKHSFNDFGLILKSKVIEPPAPKTNIVSVPSMDGSIDLSEVLTDSIKFEDRNITMTFAVIDARSTWVEKISAIENYLHGKRMKVVFDDDNLYYYDCRLVVDEWTSSKNIGNLVMQGVANPYKFEVNDDWLWNPFNFETGVIKKFPVLEVEGSKTITLTANVNGTYPTFVTSHAMTVEFKGETHFLPVGRSTIYDIIFDVGENSLKFNGNGTVKFEYRGRSL